ncbi:MAG: hypothetical protein SVU24_08245, partial [Pseudomonadota bacterium]|nr:hypothetical protein [Pseudomonadota bacterium]
MSKKRKQYSASFKSKVAPAALKGDQTTSEIAARCQIHPTLPVNAGARGEHYGSLNDQVVQPALSAAKSAACVPGRSSR